MSSSIGEILQEKISPLKVKSDALIPHQKSARSLSPVHNKIFSLGNSPNKRISISSERKSDRALYASEGEYC